MSAAEAFADLVEIMARLRGPGGCPWDREQSRESLRPYLVEEAYEVLEAIDRGDAEEIKDELGDLLLQVVFHAQLAAERGEFDAAAVARAVSAKLVRRHPHVFGDVQVQNADEVVRNWARIKAVERAARNPQDGVLSGVPGSLPALLRAQRLGEKASRVGFDWARTEDVLAKVREELGELEDALHTGDGEAAGRELGDLLLSLASLGRFIGTSAEMALRAASERFAARFGEMERRAAADGVPLPQRSAADLDRLWEAVKRRVPAAR
jgi:tetrapyrrole methylase family protein/MazG family protein